MKINMENFKNKYDHWASEYLKNITIKPSLINKRYRELSQVIDAKNDFDIINYNFYVDKIMRLSSQYVDRKEKMYFENENSRKSKSYNRLNESPDGISKSSTSSSSVDDFDTISIDETIQKRQKTERSQLLEEEKDIFMDKIEKFFDGIIGYHDINPDEL